MGFLGELFHTPLEVPPPRDFGWHLKDTSTSHFSTGSNPSGQLVAVLGHAPLRGVSCEMIHWWFRHFPRMRVRLENVPGYEGKEVPAYFLWHPVDHIGVTLLAREAQTVWEIGDKLHVQEALQADRFGTRYLVDDAMELWYLKNGDGGGQGMGKRAPVGDRWIGATRIVWSTLPGGDVHYHYEIAFGLPSPGVVGRIINNKVGGKFTEEFAQVWQRHNVIEVGAFENFLPALYEQRFELPNPLVYDAATMNAAQSLPAEQEPADPALAIARLEALVNSEDAVEMIRTTQAIGGPEVRW